MIKFSKCSRSIINLRYRLDKLKSRCIGYAEVNVHFTKLYMCHYKDPLQSSSNICTKVINIGYYALFRNYSPPTIGMTFSGPVLVSEGDEILLGWR